MHTFLKYFQFFVSLLLIIAILIQNRSSGLSSTFGGSGNTVSTTKRGPEKVVFRATIILAVLFVLASLATTFVR